MGPKGAETFQNMEKFSRGHEGTFTANPFFKNGMYDGSVWFIIITVHDQQKIH